MSDNIERTRRGFAAFAQGDLDTLRELLDPDVVWHVPGRGPLAGDHRGIEAVLGYFGQLFELSGGTVKADLVECGEIAPDLVAALVDVSATMPGGTVGSRNINLFRERDGRTVEVWEYTDDQYELDEAMVPAGVAVPGARTAGQDAPVRA